MTPESDDAARWNAYYRQLEGRTPRPLLLQVLEHFEADVSTDATRTAIDLGCGDGTESAHLLERGWRVVAIDAQAEALRRLEARIPASRRERLEARVARFEALRLPRADLIYAGLSLPFCAPTHFEALWMTILEALGGGGRFAGQLFGDRDGWASNPDMTFHTRPAAEDLFAGLEVEHFEELDREQYMASGAQKRVHAFEVIARRGS
jgi:tellurite methyltransferase